MAGRIDVGEADGRWHLRTPGTAAFENACLKCTGQLADLRRIQAELAIHPPDGLTVVDGGCPHDRPRPLLSTHRC